MKKKANNIDTSFLNGKFFAVAVLFLVAGSAAQAGTRTLLSDFAASSLTVTTGGTLATKGYEVTVTSDIFIEGQLDATDSNPNNEGDGTLVTLGRDWTASAGSTFTYADSTIQFNTVSTSTLSGATTFYGLRALTSGTTLYFTAGTTHYVVQAVEFINISLKSTVDSATWYFVYSGSSQTLTNVRVQDSNAGMLGGQTMAADGTSVSLGNNTNWSFGAVFTGGSGDGFDAALGADTDVVALESVDEQIFYVGGSSTAISTITVTQELGLAGAGINATDDIRIKIPTALAMTWRNLGTATIIGSASGKVSASVSYEDAFATLVIDVTSDFADGEYIQVGGLAFENFTSTGRSRLELEIDNTGSTAAFDAAVVTIQDPSPALTTGGAGEGFDAGASERYWVAAADGNWSDANNWADSTGGSAGAGAPGAGQTAVFDGGGLAKCTVDVPSLALQTLLFETGFTGAGAIFDTAGNGLSLAGSLYHAGGAIQLGTSTLTVGGDLLRSGGTWSAGASSVLTFASALAQRVEPNGATFGNIVSSNTSSSGLTFVSSFTAESFYINGLDLGSSATVYFSGNSTFTISTFTIFGDSSYPVVLKSTSTGAQWYLNVTSSQTAQGVQVQDSNASPGLTMVADSNSLGISNNVNWIIPTAHTWVGAGATENWNDAANWQGGALPGSSDTAIFDSRYSNKNSTINVNASVAGILIRDTYSGVIIQNSTNTITIGSQGYTQDGGEFVGGDATIDNSGSFNLSNATFTSTSGTMYVDGDWSSTGVSTFSANGGTIEFQKVGCCGDPIITAGTVEFNKVIINGNTNDSGFTIVGSMVVNGQLDIVSAGSINGDSIFISSHVVATDSSISGSATIVFNGAGDQTLSAAGGTGTVPNIEINKPSGTLTIADTIRTRVWTVTDGNIDASASTLSFFDGNGSAVTLTPGTVGYNNIVFFSNNFTPYTLSGIFDVNGDLTIQQTGSINNGNILVAGNIYSFDSGITGTSPITLDGTGDQILDLTGSGSGDGDVPNGTCTINKPSGEVRLVSHANTAFNSSNQDLIITSGTLVTNGFDVIVNDQLVIGSSGTLKLHGFETLSAGSKVLNSSATVHFTGNNNATVEVATITKYFTTYENLIFSSTGPATDVFISTANITINDDLTIGSGTFSLNGFNLTADSGLRTTYSNEATLRLNGSETISNLTQDLDSGTWEYYGNSDSSTNTYTLKDFGDDDYFNLSFNTGGSANDRFNLLETLNVLNNVTLSGGTLDVAADTNTITVQGNWIASGSGGFTARASTVTFDGTGTQNLTSGSTGFHHIVIDKASGNLNLTGPVTLSGNWTNTCDDCVVPNTSTVTFTPSPGLLVTLSGNTTFYGLRALTPGATLQFAPGTTSYVVNMVEWRDISVRSPQSGATWYFHFSGSSQTLKNLRVQDSNADDGSPMLADSYSTDLGNNNNWIFGYEGPYTWTGAVNSEWNVPGNWWGGAVPGSSDLAGFSGYSNVDANINVNASVGGLLIGPSYTGTVTQNSTNTLTIGSQGFSQAGGEFVGGDAVIDVNGLFVLSGGTFTATSNTMSVGRANPVSETSFSVISGSSFSHNGGSLVFDSQNVGCSQYPIFTIDAPTSLNLHNVTINGTIVCDGRVKFTTGPGDTIVVKGTFTHTQSYLEGNWQVEGDIVIGSGARGGAGVVALTGGGDQAYTYASGGLGSHLQVNKSAGAVLSAVGTTDLSIDLFSILSGSFTAPSGTMYVGRSTNTSETFFTVTEGSTFTHNNGTVVFDPTNSNAHLGGCSQGPIFSIDVPSTLTLNSVNINGPKLCDSTVRIFLDSSDTIIAVGTFTHTDGILGGNWEAQGNVIIGSGADGGIATLTFSGTGNQTYLDSAGTKSTGTITINKPSGTVTLLSSMTYNSAGQDIIITSGTLETNGFNLIANDQLVIGSSGTLKLHGFETLSAGTKVLNSSATVHFTGNNNSTVEVATITKYFTTYENLVFQSTGTGLDIFLSTGNITVNDDLTIGSGTFSLNGFNLSLDASRSTLSNDATLRLIGSETISNLVNDTDSGTWEYTGNGDASVNTYAIRDFGSDDYFNLTINNSGSANDRFELSEALEVNGSVNQTGGTFDVKADTNTINVQGDWVTGGQGGFTAYASTITFDGTGAQNLTTGSTGFHHIVIDKASGNLNLTGPVTLSGDWTNNCDDCVVANTSTVTFYSSQSLVHGLTGNTTFYGLRGLTVGGTMQFTPDTTQYATNMVDFNSCALRSTLDGSTWYFVYNGSSQTLKNLRVQDSNADGGSPMLADSYSTDLGNNNNWIFGYEGPYTWTGAVDNLWSTPGNWWGNAVPGASDLAAFTGYSVVDSTINVNANVAGILIAAGYSGKLTQNSTNTITIGSGGYNQAGGEFVGGASTITVDGIFTLSGGTFTSTSDNFSMNFNSMQGLSIFNVSPGAIYNHNAGTVSVNSTFSGNCGTSYTHTIDVDALIAFNHVVLNSYGACASAVRNIAAATGDTINVLGNLTITAGSLDGQWELQGDLDIGAAATGWTGMITLNGTGDQYYSYASGGTAPHLIVDKTLGIVEPKPGTTELSAWLFTLSTGVFTAPTGNFTLGRIAPSFSNHTLMMVSSGTFNHNNGTLQFNSRYTIDCGQSRTLTIDVSTYLVINNLDIVGQSGTCGGVLTYASASGDTVAALGNINISSAAIQGQWEAHGDVAVSNSAAGGSGSITFAGSNNQIYTDEGGNEPDGDVTISKPSGEVRLASNADWNAAGQDVTIASGTLVTNGYTLAVNGQLLIGSSGTLKLHGFETLSAGTKVLNSSATVHFTGNNNSTVEVATITKYFTTYENLIFSSTGSAHDVFISTANITINDDLTLSSGVLSLNGFNLTADSGLRTTYSNEATLRLRGDETISNLVNDTDSGTWEYVGIVDGAVDTFTIKDFSANGDYYNLTFLGLDGSSDTFRVGTSTLSIFGDLTISSGVFDNATNDKDIAVIGNVTMTNQQTDMGDSTWTVTGNWNHSANNTINGNSSLLVIDGDGKSLQGRSGLSGMLNALRVDGAISVDANTWANGATTIIGTMTIPSPFSFTQRTEGVYIKPSGRITGTGTLGTTTGGDIFEQSGLIDVNTIDFLGHSGVVFAPGRYDSANIYFRELSPGQNFVFSGGTYDLVGGVTFYTFTGSWNINNSINNPSFIFRKSLTLRENNSALNWNKGTGTISFSSDTAQRVDLLGQSVENIVSSNTSAGGLTFVSSFTTPSLYVNTSALGSAATIYFAGNSTFTISTFSVTGSPGLPVVLKSTDVAQWFLNVTSSPAVSYVEVSSSNATPGIDIDATNGTNVDVINNDGWNFNAPLVDNGIRYWVAPSAGNWSDASNWSLGSGGPAGGGVPLSTHTVVFDAGSTNNANLNVNVTVASMTTTSDYSGSITMIGTSSLTVTSTMTISGGSFTQGGGTLTLGGFTISSGTFSGGTALIDINGVYSQSGGTFTATISTMSVGINSNNNTDFFIVSGGTFIHNNGALRLDPRGGDCSSTIFTFDVNGSLALSKLELTMSGGDCGSDSIFIAQNDLVIVEGDLHYMLNDKRILGSTIAVAGNIYTNGVGNPAGNMALIRLNGSGTQTIERTANVGFLPRIEVDKSLGVAQPAVGTDGFTVERLTIKNGEFIAPSSMTIYGAFSNAETMFKIFAGSTFTHNNGLVVMKPNAGGCVSDAIYLDVPESVTFFSLEFSFGVPCGFDTFQIVNGSTLVVVATTTFTDGPVNNGFIEAQGNVVIGALADGGSTALIFGGGVDQSFVDYGGVKSTGTVTINKPSGSVILLSSMTYNSAGQDIIITSGTLVTNGFNLAANNQLVIGSSGTLKLHGFETVSAGSKVIQSSGTVHFTGNNNATVDVATITKYFTTYENLIFQSTGPALDVFQSTANITVNDDLTIGSGTFSLNGFNLTANVGGRTTFSNTGTLRLNGDETIATLTNDTDSGTWEYVGASGPYALYAMGSGGYYNLTIAGEAVFFIGESLVVNNDLTLTSGNLNTVSYPIAVGGHWSKSDISTFTVNGTTVTFNGSNVQQLSGSTTFYGLRALTPGATLQFALGTTNYALNMVEFRDISLKSTSDNATWYFVYNGSSQTLVGVEVQDSNAGILSGQTMAADATSTNLGNNTNWTFGSGLVDNGIRYWIGSGNWSDANNWSLESGGAISGGVPLSTHTVVFDDGSVNNADLNVNVTVASMTTTSLYSGTIAIVGTSSLTVTSTMTIGGGSFNQLGGTLTLGGFTMSSGTFSGGTALIDINGPFSLLGGTYTATSSTWTHQGNFLISGSSFIHNFGTLEFDGNTGRTITIDNETFFNLGMNVINNSTFVNIIGTFNVINDLIAPQTAGTTGGTIRVQRHVYRSSTGSFSTKVVFMGNQDQNYTAGGGTGTLTNLEVNKPSGTLFLSDDLEIAVWNNISGTVDPGTGTVYISAHAGNITSNSMPFYNFIDNSGCCSGSVVFQDLARINGNLYIISNASINGDIELAGNLTTLDILDAGTATISLIGTGDQYVSLVGDGSGNGDLPNGTFTINKPSGDVHLLSHANAAFNATNQDLVITSGALVTNGFNLVVNDQLIIGSSGTLKLHGFETVSAGSKVIQSSGTVWFTGNNDGNVDVSTITKYFTTYENLIFQSTGSAGDIFISTANITINDDLTLSSGVLSLNGFNLTADSGLRTTYSNEATLRLRGDETISNLVNDTDSGTWEYVGAAGPYNLYDSGAADYYNLTINGNAVFDGGTNEFVVNGDVSVLNGTLGMNNASMIFAGTGAQRYQGKGETFARVISSNTSSSGLIFSSSFTTSDFVLRTSDLGSSATVYFAGNSTFTISTFTVTGSPGLPVVLKSTDTSQWVLNVTSSQSVSYVEVSSSNANPGLQIVADNSTDRGNNVNWDFAAPGDVTDLTAVRGPVTGSIDLRWSAPGDEGASGTLNNSTFTIQYTTSSSYSGWDPASQPSFVFTVHIPTNATPGAPQGRAFAGLSVGATYYFRLWTKDDVGRYSTISNATSSVATEGQAITWLGVTSEWDDISNWSTGQKPGVFDNVVIPMTGADPVLSSTAEVASISLAANASLIIRGATFTVTGSVQSNGTLVLSSTEVLTLPGNVWDVDSGTVSYEGSGTFNGLTAGATYYGLVFNNPTGSWSVDQSVGINGNFELGSGILDLNTSTLTVFGDTIYTNGVFNAGTSVVDLTGNGRVSGFSGANSFYDLNVAPAALTTTLTSDIDVTHGINFGGGIVAELGTRNITLTSSLAQPIVINAGTSMNFTSFTWITTHATPILPSFNGYPSLSLHSSINTAGSQFTLDGNVTASTVNVYNVGASTFTNVDLDGFSLNADALYIGESTTSGRGEIFVRDGNLNVNGNLLFLNPASTLNLGTSTGSRVGGDFLYGGSSGTFINNRSTMIFSGTGRQYIHSHDQNLGSIFSTNVSTSGITFVSSFTAINMTVETGGLGEGATLYFAGATTATITGNLRFSGSPSLPIVLKSTSVGDAWYLIAPDNHTIDYVDVQDSDASAGPTILASNSIDRGGNVNWDFGPPSPPVLGATGGPSARQITLSWVAPGDDGSTGSPLVGEYRINVATSASQIASASTATAQIVISTSGVTPGVTVSTSVINLSLGVTYYFKLNAVDDVSRWSGFSNTTSTVLHDNYAPEQIIDLVAIATSNEGEVQLTWTAPDEDDGAQAGEAVSSYQIRFSTVSLADLSGDTTSWWLQAISTPTPPLPQSPGQSESYTLTLPDYGVTYYFAIRSVDNSNNVSPISNVDDALPLDMVPQRVGNFQAIGSQNQVALSWTSGFHADFWKYSIYRSSAVPINLALLVEITTESVSSYVDIGLENGVTFYYQVYTVDRGTPTYVGPPLSSATAIVGTETNLITPNAPVIISSETLAQSTASINWSWTQITPPSVNGFRFYAGTANVSGNLAASATTYLQTGLWPNQQISGRVEAFNAAGTALSIPLSRYALANPPVNSAFIGVGARSIQVGWQANNNVSTPTYHVEYSNNVDFSNRTIVQSATTNVTLNNLLPARVYYIRVRATNGDGIYTGYDVGLATVTAGSPDIVPPAVPGGVWSEVLAVSGSSVTLQISWDPVLINADGSTLDDLAGYVVHADANYLMPTTSWSETLVTMTTVTLTVSIDPATYIAVRAVDVNGNQSANSMIIRTSDMKMMVVADDLESWMEFPLAQAAKLRANWAGNNGMSYYMRGVEEMADYGQASVIKSIKFYAYKAADAERSNAIAMEGAAAQVFMKYNVSGGQVVQGKGGKGSSLRYSISDKNNKASIISNIEDLTPLAIPAAQAARKLALFWHNGVTWVKVGGSVDTNNQFVSYQTSRLGSYQIKVSAQLGDASLVQVYPRIITPNNDGANDVVIFQFGEGDLAGRSLTGEIFDITGVKVADLKAGPDPDSTLIWDGRTNSGQWAPSGIYIYQLSVAGERVNGTVVVAR